MKIKFILFRYILVLAHKLTKFNDVVSQEALIFKPDENIWLHLNEQVNLNLDQLKNNHVVHLLGKLYFIGENSTFTFEYESLTFKEGTHLVHQRDTKHLSFVYMNK